VNDTTERPARILVVDDVVQNVRLLADVLTAHGYAVLTAADGEAALELAASDAPDLVLLDVVMPGIDGYAVCESLRNGADTAMVPVIMVTSSVGHEKLRAIEAGADDFIPKPFDQHELLARVRSLLRIKRYHDTITAQAAELLELNGTLEERVQTQLEELERLQRLRRFLSPQLADAVAAADASILRSHRRQVAMFFADLRGWTSFVDAVEPEELMRVLGEFHGTIGELVKRFDATVGFIEGDGVQLFFNDPIEVPDAALRAVRLGCALREEMAKLMLAWRKRGYDLGFGAGIALGYATCGEVGFEGRFDYAAIGAVTNLASRLADEAAAGQILIAQRLHAEVEDDVEAESAGEFTLKGFQRPVTAFNVVALRRPVPAGGAVGVAR
jgi:adenylate cyclase